MVPTGGKNWSASKGFYLPNPKQTITKAVIRVLGTLADLDYGASNRGTGERCVQERLSTGERQEATREGPAESKRPVQSKSTAQMRSRLRG